VRLARRYLATIWLLSCYDLVSVLLVWGRSHAAPALLRWFGLGRTALWDGDNGGDLFGVVFPAIDDLAGADKDARADRGHAVLGDVEVSDVGDAADGVGRAAEDGEVSTARNAPAAGRRADEQHGRRERLGDAVQQPNRPAGVGDAQQPDGVGTELRPAGRIGDLGLADSRERAVDLNEGRMSRMIIGRCFFPFLLGGLAPL